ncbi:hypothetical protein HMPREF1580_00524 [Gardnerella vaginalis JCP8070]|nr:hypothetical protein HMPREF1580_00524 [Gardnerella vaginalis JCP8070]
MTNPLRGIREEDIVKYFKDHNLSVDKTYVFTMKYDPWWKDLIKLFLLPKLFYVAQGVVARIIAATNNEFIVVNPNVILGSGNLAKLDDKYLRCIAWNQLTNFEVINKPTTQIIRFTANGKTEEWSVPTESASVWQFNVYNLDNLRKTIQSHIS